MCTVNPENVSCLYDELSHILPNLTFIKESHVSLLLEERCRAWTTAREKHSSLKHHLLYHNIHILHPY